MAPPNLTGIEVHWQRSMLVRPRERTPVSQLKRINARKSLKNIFFLDAIQLARFLLEVTFRRSLKSTRIVCHFLRRYVCNAIRRLRHDFFLLNCNIFQMMIMLMFLEKEFGKSGRSIEDAPIGWILHGRAFAIRDSKALVKDVLPLFFRQAKFSSFTRKLYRWEFRQINTSADARQTTGILFFANENFRRDKTHLLSKMKSVTAASMRRQKEKGGHSRSATDSKDPSKSKPAASSPVLESPISFGLQSLTSLATNPLFTSASGRLGPLSSSHVQQNALQQVLTAAGLHRHFALTSTLPFGTDSPTNALLVMMQSARNPFLPSALPQSFALAGSLAPNFHQQPSSDQEGFHTLLEALTRSSQQSPS